MRGGVARQGGWHRPVLGLPAGPAIGTKKTQIHRCGRGALRVWSVAGLQKGCWARGSAGWWGVDAAKNENGGRSRRFRQGAAAAMRTTTAAGHPRAPPTPTRHRTRLRGGGEGDGVAAVVALAIRLRSHRPQSAAGCGSRCAAPAHSARRRPPAVPAARNQTGLAKTRRPTGWWGRPPCSTGIAAGSAASGRCRGAACPLGRGLRRTPPFSFPLLSPPSSQALRACRWRETHTFHPPPPLPRW